jgi:hypothetical protein
MDRYQAKKYVKNHPPVDLSSASSGMCCVGHCDRQAFPYSVAGCDGYVDTCAAHAADAIVDALVAGTIACRPGEYPGSVGGDS